jgi:hypothetical protein
MLRRLRRKLWCIASVAALFGLQAPLCAIACEPSAQSSQVAEAPADPPCHEPAPSSAPSPAPSSAEDCCEVSYDAPLLPSPEGTPSPPALCFSTQIVAWQPSAPLRSVRATSSDADLPPPDRLLLKATLLI